MASSRPLPFTVRAWASWNAASARAASSAGTPDPPPPALLRRRVGVLGQQALRLAWGIGGAGEARLVASSRHGEFGRTLGILDRIIAAEPVSPAEFTLSVHHALIGLLSIACGNRRGHTAVAAGPESFGFGFLEALCCLAETPDEPVLLIHYDEQLPEPFTNFASDTGPAMALVVALAAGGPGEAMTLRLAPRTVPGASLPDSLAAGFCGFLGDRTAPRLTAAGARMTWQWSRDAAPVDAAPVDAAPVDAAPVDAAPVDAAPA